MNGVWEYSFRGGNEKKKLGKILVNPKSGSSKSKLLIFIEEKVLPRSEGGSKTYLTSVS